MIKLRKFLKEDLESFISKIEFIQELIILHNDIVKTLKISRDTQIDRQKIFNKTELFYKALVNTKLEHRAEWKKLHSNEDIALFRMGKYLKEAYAYIGENPKGFFYEKIDATYAIGHGILSQFIKKEKCCI
jgi:hypothetical protein